MLNIPIARMVSLTCFVAGNLEKVAAPICVFLCWGFILADPSIGLRSWSFCSGDRQSSINPAVHFSTCFSIDLGVSIFGMENGHVARERL